ncbi:HK97 family phage prohead protease [Bradyrhizobium japonicum USDA 38]|uniref:HK97 family phage prohead protease n=1 Tax=Bradyrhizobium japonicum TaxID=375 RepID=UPI000484211F|nr:HK97 family phage prohead protease [Bradyrhizobium japonicum]MCS3503427.1 HK97 family phage prohead protease [Bradyrhizobium japonicum]MCS3895577.1 HK97 family phage prohead protease [Bradyrhizobium japonicum USDA 38]MCS3948092.1 HK97 family phage prohead protease [Bradyrhizobium japonicum]MCS3963854.1 HK97 family phage prohead protease [Bradyrhizobium japonicum]MCS3996167.1 HK97 family phage prohead protease [Bradyrhizobium japonicum]
MADKISGWALQWGQPAIIAGAFEERFARGAFDKHLAQNPDVAALWAHDPSRPLGRVSNGLLKLRSDAIGLHFLLEPDPAAPLGQEALATVGNGTVTEVSVSFTPVVEEWTDDGDIPKRLITEARLYEISLVLWGAYGKATSAQISRASSNKSAARRRIEEAQRRRGIL